MKRQQSVNGTPPLYKRSPAPLAGDHLYCEMGRPRMVLMVASKGQKLHKNYVEDPMGETHNPII